MSRASTIRTRVTAIASATVFFSAGLAGCSPRPGTPPLEVSLTIGDETDLARVLSAETGNVVLVDYWATWCPPCVELFPHAIALQREFGGKGLRVVTISLDEPENEAIVRRFLQTRGAMGRNFLSRYGNSSRSLDRFDLPGALPILRLYDRGGHKLGDYPSEIKSIDELDRRIRGLVNLAPQ